MTEQSLDHTGIYVAGFDVNVANDGDISMFHYAINNGLSDVIPLLVQHGAYIHRIACVACMVSIHGYYMQERMCRSLYAVLRTTLSSRSCTWQLWLRMVLPYVHSMQPVSSILPFSSYFTISPCL
jgi:hypothetical protein